MRLAATWIFRVLVLAGALLIAETGVVGVPSSIFSQVHFLAAHNGEWGFRVLAIVLAVILVLLAIGPERASAWVRHLKADEAPPKGSISLDPRPRSRVVKRPPNTPRNDDPAYQALTAVMHSGSAVLERFDRGEVQNIFEEGGNWASRARDEIEALTDPTEAVLFDQTSGNPDIQIRTKIEYIRDRLLPKAREGYWPFDKAAVERRREALAHKRTKAELAALREKEQTLDLRKKAAAKAAKSTADLQAQLDAMQPDLVAMERELERGQRERYAHEYTGLASDFEAFVIAARSTQPKAPQLRARDFVDSERLERKNAATERYLEIRDEWWRKTVGEYHAQFRSRVMPALKGSDLDGEKCASEPQDLGELQRIQTALEQVDLRRQARAHKKRG